MALSEAEEFELLSLERERAHATAPAIPATQEPGVWEAGGRGAIQGATLGFADEIAGAGHAGLQAARKMSLSDVVKDYLAKRDSYRAADKAAQQEHPYAYGGGQIAGGVGSAIGTPALGIIKGAGLAANAARVAGAGALAGFGSSEANTPSGNAQDAALGAGSGLVGMGIGNLAARAIPTAAGSAALAVKKAITHLRPTPKVARVMGPARLAEVGREALDSGAIQPWTKAEQTAANLAGQRETVGKAIGGFVDNAKTPISASEVAEKFQKEVIDPMKGTADVKGPAEAADLVSTLEKKKNQFLEHYGVIKRDPETGEYLKDETGNLLTTHVDLTPKQIELEKRAVQGGINYLTDPKAAQQAKMGYATVLKDAGEKAIDNPDFVAAKQKFSKIADAQMMADRTAGLTDSGTGLLGHLHDISATQVAAHAALSGEPLTAAAVAGGRALLRGNVASGVAVGADRIAKFLEKNPRLNAAATGAETAVKQGGPVATRAATSALFGQKDNNRGLDAEDLAQRLGNHPDGARFGTLIKNAASRGPDSLAATHFILQQTEPDYQKAMNGD